MASLRDCRTEINGIIRDLQDVSWTVRHCAQNLGQDLCADCIDRVVARCQEIKKRLDRVDTNRLADWILGDQDE